MKITVFTPTYNRCQTLFRLYESLCQQSYSNFEWIIVDDGSTDKTDEQIQRIAKTALFPIRYYKKENGGKHTAHNLAIEKASGDYFFCVDSDDYLSSDALLAISEVVQRFPSVVGVVALKACANGELLSDKLPHVQCVGSLIELNERYRCRGEFSIALKTNIARENPYPVFCGENFIGELVIYDRFCRKDCFALLPKVVTICEYQPDGLSARANHLMRENPAGYCLYFMQRIDLVSGFFERLLMAGKYQCFGILARGNRTAYRGKHRLLTAACYPVGMAFLAYYKMFRGF